MPGSRSTTRIRSRWPRRFEDSGVTRLHLVDLDGAKASHVVNYKTLEQIAGHTGLTIDFGGGVKSDEDLRISPLRVVPGW